MLKLDGFLETARAGESIVRSIWHIGLSRTGLPHAALSNLDFDWRGSLTLSDIESGAAHAAARLAQNQFNPARGTVVRMIQKAARSIRVARGTQNVMPRIANAHPAGSTKDAFPASF